MGRIEKLLLLALGVGICGLLLAMFFVRDTASGHTGRIYNVSILVRNPSERFIKGLDQAALDYNVDVHYASGYGHKDSERQIEYLKRELSGNVDAVVLQAEDAGAMGAYLNEARFSAPVVTVGQKLQSGRTVHVGADDVALGEELGELIARRWTGGVCLVLSPVDAKPHHTRRADALGAVLERYGTPFSMIHTAPGSINSTLEGRDSAVVALLDESLLVPACEQARESDMLFGVGYTSGARAYLESGRIQGLIVYSEYDAGYLSLQEAVLMADGKTGTEAELGLYVADADTMHLPPLVYILFPIG